SLNTHLPNYGRSILATHSPLAEVGLPLFQIQEGFRGTGRINNGDDTLHVDTHEFVPSVAQHAATARIHFPTITAGVHTKNTVRHPRNADAIVTASTAANIGPNRTPRMGMLRSATRVIHVLRSAARTCHGALRPSATPREMTERPRTTPEAVIPARITVRM